jgi:hypothetical protein
MSVIGHPPTSTFIDSPNGMMAVSIFGNRDFTPSHSALAEINIVIFNEHFLQSNVFITF